MTRVVIEKLERVGNRGDIIRVALCAFTEDGPHDYHTMKGYPRRAFQVMNISCMVIGQTPAGITSMLDTS